MPISGNLTSVPTLVQSPFIIAKIGDVTFGSYTSSESRLIGVQYPDYMDSCEIQKINGMVNMYTLSLSYKVNKSRDPNLLDKILSKAAVTRRIVLQYGDWCRPNMIYKEEQAIITSVTTNLDLKNSKIQYTLSCTGDAVGLGSVPYDFPKRVEKPSTIIKELLSNHKYGLDSIFKGMNDTLKVQSMNLIASNDAVVELQAQTSSTVLSYLDYLVNCMIRVGQESNSVLQKSKYMIAFYDDVNEELGGAYFKVVEVPCNQKITDTIDTYVLDINYPQDNFVTEFRVNNDQSWAILYDYSNEIDQDSYYYRFDVDGQLHSEYCPAIVRSKITGDYSPYLSNWWTNMTQFPIEATVTLKGLTRPSMLMSYVRLNVYFEGGYKHISSGLYVITKQVDRISSAGYTTTLTLLRVGGDENDS